MRGKESLSAFQYSHVGITPAYAGKSHERCHTFFLWRDHPCVCGEKSDESSASIQATGSPLRMRGKADRLRPADAPDRITPAYAGKSNIFLNSVLARKDHPCVCGEK